MSEDFITGDEFDPIVAQRSEDVKYERQQEHDAAVVAHLARTEQAYRAVFIAGNASPDDVDFVMRDLSWFSKIDTHYFPDTRLQDVYIGRKQVMQRIMEYTRLDHDTLVKRYIETQTRG